MRLHVNFMCGIGKSREVRNREKGSSHMATPLFWEKGDLSGYYKPAGLEL